MPGPAGFSFYTISFKGESFRRGAERLAGLGFDAVEVPADPELFSGKEVRAVLSDTGLQASGVCGRMYGPERDLTAADATNRAKAIDYYSAACEFAGRIGAPILIIAPTSVRRVLPETSREQEWEWALSGIAAIADRAKDSGVSIAIEAWNRYESYLVNRLDEADLMRRQIGRDNVGIMGDLFHMNIEEIDIAGAIRKFGDHLLNIHFADSNRQAPGRGHIELAPVMAALRAIGYRHYLSAELLPPRALMEGERLPEDFYSAFPGETIENLRRAWQTSEGDHA
jgi:sugar phosphate isomerase/epimerase